jgi:hypothetical protein
MGYMATKVDLRGESPEDLVDAESWSRRLEQLLPVWTAPAAQQRVLSAIAKRPT